VELFLNGESQGRKTVKTNALLAWPVKYAPGTLLARAYTNGKEVLTNQVETTGEPAALQITPHKPAIQADGTDVAIITVQANDAQGRSVPTASSEVAFAITGPGKIVGVGNGDPSSHEADQYVGKSAAAAVSWRMLAVNSVENRPEVTPDFDDSAWQSGFGATGGRGGGGRRGAPAAAPAATNIYRGSFELADTTDTSVSLMLRDLGERQWIYLNGKPVAENVARSDAGHQYEFAPAALRAGKNVIAIVATPAAGGGRGRGGQAGPGRGGPAVVSVVTAAGGWKRSLFNGLAEVIVQSTGQPGEITLTATARNLAPAVLKVQAQAAPSLPSAMAEDRKVESGNLAQDILPHPTGIYFPPSDSDF
jgi:beta-galactosidase